MVEWQTMTPGRSNEEGVVVSTVTEELRFAHRITQGRNSIAGNDFRKVWLV
jgi:hypothetical protein